VVYLTTKPGAQHLSGKTMEDPGINGRIILRCIFPEVGCGGMDWFDLAQDTDR